MLGSISRIGRIVLIVKDFERSMRFYRDGLGLRLRSSSGSWAVFETGSVLLCLRAQWEGMPYRGEDLGRSPDEVCSSWTTWSG